MNFYKKITLESILGILLLSFLSTNCSNNNNMEITPIGYIKTDYTPETGAPRQGVLVPDSKGIIELNSEYEEGLKELDEFEYIIVLFWFSEAGEWEATIQPPNSKHEFGVFATRSPKRPNPIGQTIVKLDKIEGNKLYVSGIDMFNNTPIIDIKPYLPSIDCMKSKKNEEAEHELGHHDEEYLKDSTFWK